MLTKLTRLRVHVIFATVTIGWFSLMTILGVIDGDGFLNSLWTSVKEVKLMEWVMVPLLWMTMASTVKELDELRAKVRLQESRQ